uniref:Uncharacterized protein n=1 Tax=Anguilla anguilla TaxID=7936 RepID=A0A0E9R7G8_ANGAN
MTTVLLIIVRASGSSPPCDLKGFKLLFQWLSSRGPHRHPQWYCQVTSHTIEFLIETFIKTIH